LSDDAVERFLELAESHGLVMPGMDEWSDTTDTQSLDEASPEGDQTSS